MESVSKKHLYVGIVICILFFCQLDVFSQTIWYRQTTGTTEDLHALTMGFRYTMCMVGANGLIMTGQEFNTLSISESGVTVSLNDVCFCSYFPNEPNSTWGFAVGNGGTILKTTDVGKTWTKLKSTTTADLNGVFFIDPAIGYAVGDSGVFLATSDSGATWERRDLGATKNLNSIHFFFSEYSGVLNGAIAGDDGILLLSTDTGNSWKIKSVPATVNFNKAKMVYGGIYVVGDSGVVVRSTDFCNTYNLFTTGIVTKLRNIIPSSNGGQYVAIVGDSGTVLQNFTNPNALTLDNTGTKSTLFGGYSYVGACRLPFWVVGSEGTMMLKDIGGAVRDPNIVAADFCLFPNYPNPFNPSTNISFQIPNAAHVTLDLFSITGEKIASLVNEQLQSGHYTQQINSQSLHLASGTYLCRMTAIEDGTHKVFTQSQKIILMK